jgi:hypothetical protein
MRPRQLCLMMLLVPLVLLLAPSAGARTIEWTKVEVREGDDVFRVSKVLRKELGRATRNATWGKGDPLKLNARVTRLDWTQSDDVLRVTVTVVARITGAQGARSHIRIGGRADERTRIERQALRIVAGGLVTRLSEMARAKSVEDQKRAEAAKKEAEAVKKAEEEKKRAEKEDDDDY